jgi:hypothetical protein
VGKGDLVIYGIVANMSFDFGSWVMETFFNAMIEARVSSIAEHNRSLILSPVAC